MKHPSRKTKPCRFALALLYISAAMGQIPQANPELCGDKSHAVPLPPGTTFSLKAGDELTFAFTFVLKNGATKTIDLELPEAVEEVCPIGGDRLLVFGTVAGGDGLFVWILSQIDGAKLDLLGSQREPAVSPDQHWIVYRRYYPRSVEIPTDEYLLYDLTLRPAENRLPSDTPVAPNPPGRQIYPATEGHVPLNGALVEPRRLHAFASDAFYWSPDSHFVAFADRLEASDAVDTSIVVVHVGQGNLTTYIHSLQTREMCGGKDLSGRIASGATLHGVDFGPAQGQIPQMWLHFSREGEPGSIHPECAAPVSLRHDQLKLAEIEARPKPTTPKR